MNKLLSKREVAETLSFSMRKFLAFFERLYLSLSIIIFINID